jgi:glycosyl transferase family 25
MGKTNLEWRYLEAIDGSQIDLITVPYFPDKVKRLLGFELTPKELGCYLSHMKAWKHCLENDIPTLIFEDDFVIADNLEEVLSVLLDSSLDWDMVRLQALVDSEYREVKDLGKFKIIRNLSDPLGATAYLIKPRSAYRLLNSSTEIFEPLDHYIEHVAKHGLTLLAVKPYPVTVSDPTRQTSTITDRPERRSVRGITKLYRSICRTIDRVHSKNPYFPK